MKTIEEIIKDSERIAFLSADSDMRMNFSEVKESILKNRKIEVDKLNIINFDDIASIVPNVEGNAVFDRYRTSNCSLYNIFSRNKEGNLEPFKYVLAVWSRYDKGHKHIETTSKEVKDWTNEEILEALDML